jgi:phosphomannomutase
VLPDPDEPLLHIYAEARTDEQSSELEHELRSLVEDIMRKEDGVEEQISS